MNITEVGAAFLFAVVILAMLGTACYLEGRGRMRRDAQRFRKKEDAQ